MPIGVYVRNPRPPMSAEQIEAKFWAQVGRSDGCWTWNGLRDNGYGRFAPARGTDMKAHRFAWELTQGPLGRDRIVRHTCGNRACVNPAHLCAITVREERRNRVPREHRERPTPADRFWSRVRKGAGCWEWKNRPSSNGYGRVLGPNRRVLMAHRVAWELTHGPIPEGRVVMHACDNRICVNPDHLMIGTQRANIIDAARKKRLYNARKTHCIHGHALTPDNVYQRKRASGGRTCLTCRRAYNGARKKRLRAERLRAG